MSISTNRIIFDHTVAGKKYVVKIKPIRSDGRNTSYTDYVKVVSGDISPLSTLTSLSSSFTGAETENAVSASINNFNYPLEYLNTHWRLQKTSDKVQINSFLTTADIGVGDAAIPYTSLSGVSQASSQVRAMDYIWMDDELIQITSVDASQWEVTRGALNTAASTHLADSAIYKEVPPHAYSVPTTVSDTLTESFQTTPQDTSFIYARWQNKFGYLSEWELIHKGTAPKSNAQNLAESSLNEFSTQVGNNLLQNWSFENVKGTGVDAKSWDITPPTYSNVSTLKSFTYSGLGLSYDYYLGDRLGAFSAGITVGASGEWGAFTPHESTLSTSVVLHPNVTKYSLHFRSAYGILPTDLSAAYIGNLPPLNKAPIIKALLYEYTDIDGTTPNGTIVQSSDAFKLANIKGKSFSASFSNFDSSTKSFRIGFRLSVYNKIPITFTGSIQNGGTIGASVGNIWAYLDAASLCTGELRAGLGPFILTEDHQSAADIAEKYICRGNAEEGDIVCFDEPINGNPSVRVANKEAADGRPLMCVSENYFFSLQDEMSKAPENFNTINIGLTGRVLCKVQGPIQVNDPITLLDKGIGTKANKGDYVLGYAITNHLEETAGAVYLLVK